MAPYGILGASWLLVRRMKSLFGRPAFLAGDEPFLWEDVLIASVRWGEWATCERDTTERLACARWLEAAGEVPSTSEVADAAAEFRYARDLIAADDTVEWLARFGLTAGDWMEFIRAGVAAKLVRSRGALADAQRHQPSTSEVWECMPVSLVATGTISRVAQSLAERAAAQACLSEHGLSDNTASTVESAARACEAVEVVSRAFGVLDTTHLADRTRVVSSLDHTLTQFGTYVIASETLSNLLVAHRLDWIRVELRSLHFTSEPSAREAYLCVREDGTDLSQVALEAGVQVHQANRWLDEFELPLRDRMLGARAGEVIGPLRENGGFALHLVDAKRLPTLDDPEVRQRAESRAITRALAHEVNERIRWKMAL